MATLSPTKVSQSVTTTPATIAIAVLGSFRLELQGEVTPIASESKSEHLLVSLAIAPQHRLARFSLLERLWPQVEPTLASQSLHTLTHHLNKLSSHSQYSNSLILHDNGYYQLNPVAGLWVDCDQFIRLCDLGGRLLRQGEVIDGLRYCEQALSLYQGDLCGDSSLQTTLERERLRIHYLDLLALLGDYYCASSQWMKALDYIRHLLEQDPCREDAHRQAMRCYMRLGWRAQALRQYRFCSDILTAEFAATPEPATVALFDQIRLHPGEVC